MNLPCPDEELLLEYAEGSLTSSRRSRVAEHLAACRDCRHLMAVMDGPEPELSETRRTDGEPGVSGRHAIPGIGAFMVKPVNLGRFVLLRRLGAGAMGAVYSAYDEQLDRRVAVKVLLHEVDDRAKALVEREARAMARLTHPNVVHVYEVGHDADELYIAMEFVEGQTLARWQEGRDWREVVQAYRLAGEGLSAAHAVGLVHRDFKPHNVMVQSGEGPPRVKVLDFGLARRTEILPSQDGLGAPEPATGPADRRVVVTRLTGHGRMVGTPAYMAPEQFETSDVSAAADQFSFCVALWEGLYGRRPFAGSSPEELRIAVREGGRPAAPHGATVPSWLHDVVSRGLARSIDERWPSMRALLEALDRSPAHGRASSIGVGVATGLVGIAAVAAVAWPADPVEPCRGAARSLEDAWGDTPRAAAEAAMVGTQLPYAADTWTRVSAELDDYAEGWQAMHTEVCRATTVRGEQTEAVMDLRMACLHRAKVSLAAVATTLAEADEEVVRNALEVVGSLRPLSRCEDIAALQAGVEPPSAAEAEAVDQVRAHLAKADAERRSGRFEAAQRAVDLARSALDGVEYGPMRTEFALENAIVLLEVGEYEASVTEFERVIELAARWGQREPLAAAAIELLYVLGYELQRFEQGYRYRALAFGLAADDPALEAVAAKRLGSVFYGQGRYEEAEAQLRRALALNEQTLGLEHPAVASSLASLGAVLVRREQHEEAAEVIQRSLALRLELLGPDHPALAQSYDALSAALLQRGDYDGAVVPARQALALRERVLGPEHRYVANSHNTLGYVLIARGEYAEAETSFRAALELRERLLKPDHPDIATARNGLATVFHYRGEHARAEQEFRAVVGIRERALDPEHPALSAARNNLAVALQNQGRYEDAVAEHRQVLAVREKSWGRDHPDVAQSLHNLASALHKSGHDSEAEAHMRESIEICEKVLGLDHPEVASSRHGLAQIVHAQGRHDEAEPEARRALEIRLEALGTDHLEVAMTRSVLASVLLARGEIDEARELAELAWERLSRDDVPQEERATTAFVLARVLWRAGRDPATRERAEELGNRAVEEFERAGGSLGGKAEEVRAWLAEPRKSPLLSQDVTSRGTRARR